MKLNNLQKKQYEAIHNRINTLANRGLEICSEYQPDQSSSFNSITCNDCGYKEALHLLRDARDIIRDLIEEKEK